jgi:hypothetical protein
MPDLIEYSWILISASAFNLFQYHVSCSLWKNSNLQENENENEKLLYCYKYSFDFSEVLKMFSVFHKGL